MCFFYYFFYDERNNALPFERVLFTTEYSLQYRGETDDGGVCVSGRGTGRVLTLSKLEGMS